MNLFVIVIPPRRFASRTSNFKGSIYDPTVGSFKLIVFSYANNICFPSCNAMSIVQNDVTQGKAYNIIIIICKILILR